MALTRPAVALLLAAAAAGCAHPASESEPMTSIPATPSGLRELHAEVRVPGLERRTFNHAELWAALAPVVDDAQTLRVAFLGRSGEGREIRSVVFGSGPTRVLMWSQMHGDESTATMALADVYAFIARRPGHPIARAILENLTVTTIPMLNPDGAQRFQRRNAWGIDINRDARRLASPEARILKGMYDEVAPQFAFNLHDQDVGTRLGLTDEHVAIALLSPAYDETRDVNDVRLRAMKVAAAFRQAIEPMVGGHVARYDDTFNPRAFGDLTTTWGASAVLVESGGWPGDPEKQFLRSVNFVGLLAALYAIADGSYASFDAGYYRELPMNGRQLPDLLVYGGTLALPGMEPVRADIMIEYRDPVRRTNGFIIEVGDLEGRMALDTVDVEGLFIIPDSAAFERSHGPQIAPGSPAHFRVTRGLGAETLWRFEGGPPPE